ncbi:hypothetical protein NM208_g5841 [Fusarium decemcellulare]|uniref:Uncharacterized protein n=2 Tax=Fusarium decemcellulare TaxID=57161 RepID=A0ACC1SDT2_9HYPO|nr:hypothetical protein NM208_g6310 [Fusarium decemcellulare]KAJ3538583.1 hypothetical protein NM208_g5841 [Fusarium decemcellulare]
MAVFRKDLPSYVMPGQPVPPHREWISLDHNDLAECLTPWIGDNPTLEQRRNYMDLYLDWILTRGIDESEKIRQQAERNVVLQRPFWIDMSEDDFEHEADKEYWKLWFQPISPQHPPWPWHRRSTSDSYSTRSQTFARLKGELHLDNQENLRPAPVPTEVTVQGSQMEVESLRNALQSKNETITNLKAQLQSAKDGLAEKEDALQKKDEVIQSLQKTPNEHNLSKDSRKCRRAVSPGPSIRKHPIAGVLYEFASRASSLPVADGRMFDLETILFVAEALSEEMVLPRINDFLQRSTLDRWFCFNDVQEKGHYAQPLEGTDSVTCWEHQVECRHVMVTEVDSTQLQLAKDILTEKEDAICEISQWMQRGGLFRCWDKPAADTIKTQQPDQPPSTPATAEAPAVILMSAGPADLSQFDDAGIHQFLATNPTVKNVVAPNIKKELDVESSKLKTELEGGLCRLESRHSSWSRRSWSGELKVEDGAGVNTEDRCHRAESLEPPVEGLILQ